MPTSLDDEKIKEIEELHFKGYSDREIAKELDIAKSTAWNYTRRLKEDARVTDRELIKAIENGCTASELVKLFSEKELSLDRAQRIYKRINDEKKEVEEKQIMSVSAVDKLLDLCNLPDGEFEEALESIEDEWKRQSLRSMRIYFSEGGEEALKDEDGEFRFIKEAQLTPEGWKAIVSQQLAQALIQRMTNSRSPPEWIFK